MGLVLGFVDGWEKVRDSPALRALATYYLKEDNLGASEYVSLPLIMKTVSSDDKYMKYMG